MFTQECHQIEHNLLALKCTGSVENLKSSLNNVIALSRVLFIGSKMQSFIKSMLGH